VLSSWAKIGAVPLTRKCLGHKTVRQEVGGDAPHSARLEALGEQHRENQKTARAAGLNVGHFDATVPTYSHVARALSAGGRFEALVASGKSPPVPSGRMRARSLSPAGRFLEHRTTSAPKL
jgi:hypothetical protein